MPSSAPSARDGDQFASNRAMQVYGQLGRRVGSQLLNHGIDFSVLCADLVSRNGDALAESDIRASPVMLTPVTEG